MSFSSSLILIIVCIVIYAILIEIYSVLFRITGLSKDKSRFQAISLLTNCGYTTTESEVIATDHTRRRVALASMLTGYTFSVVIVSLLINVFLSLNMQQFSQSIIYTLGALVTVSVIFLFFRIPKVRKAFDFVIEKIAFNLFKRKRKDNLITLLDSYGKDSIAEIYISRIPEILFGRTLVESQIKSRYKMNFLMYTRKGKTHEANKDTMFQKGDVLVVYGNTQNIYDLFLESTKKFANEPELKSETNNNLDLIENYGNDAMMEVTIRVIPYFLANCTLFESGIRSKYKLNVMTLKRNEVTIPVNKDTKIEFGDIIVVFGPYQNIKNAFIHDVKAPTDEGKQAQHEQLQIPLE